MLLKVDVLHAAWQSLQNLDSPQVKKSATLLLSPQGEVLSQKMAQELAQFDQLILVCAHYEGVDERFIDLCVDREVSIGDYILTGGEFPALILADVVTRLIPGVLRNPRSLSQESFENGLLKYPQYTRPRVFRDGEVPSILLHGDHPAIESWRMEQSQQRTQKKRMDLYQAYLSRPKPPKV